MVEPKLGGRVVAFGPGIDAIGIAGLITGIAPVLDTEGAPRRVTLACWPPMSSTALLLNNIPIIEATMQDEHSSFYCVPAAPEPMAVEMHMKAFAAAIEPMIALMVEGALASEDLPDGKVQG